MGTNGLPWPLNGFPSKVLIVVVVVGEHKLKPPLFWARGLVPRIFIRGLIDARKL